MTETKTILIVDSCKSDRYLLQGWLREELDQNYQILEAENIAKGLELWRSQSDDFKIDLVITDIDFSDSDDLDSGLAILLPSQYKNKY